MIVPLSHRWRWFVALLLAGAPLASAGAVRAAAIHTVCASGCEFPSVSAAVSASSAGDAIEVMPGTYDEQVVVNKQLTISGATGEPRPVIEHFGTASAALTIAAGGAGTTVSDLDIRGIGPSTSALVALGAVTATDLDLTAAYKCAELAGAAPSQLGPGVTATTASVLGPCVDAGQADRVIGVTVNAPGAIGVNLDNGATLTGSTVNAGIALNMSSGTVRRSTLNGTAIGVNVASTPTAALVSDSVVTSTADGGVAVLAVTDDMFQIPVILRNVTAIASGNGSAGLEAASQYRSNVTAAVLDARKVIARGGAHDVFAQAGSSSSCNGPCAPGQVIIGYSNFVTAMGLVDTTIGHNQSADPLLVNPVTGAGQDFHIASSNSPLIGAGTPDPSDGPTDRDGVAHHNPPAIGAYEYPVPPAPPSAIPPPGEPGGTTAPHPRGRLARPTISELAETNGVFTVAPRSTPVRGSTAALRHKRGTTFLFGLDQAATVTVVIGTTGRCQRTGPAARRERRCAQPVATLIRRAHAALNKVPFSGRIHGRALKPGDYHATFTATNNLGRSSPRTLRFRVVGR
jgi:hypothetical protein